MMSFQNPPRPTLLREAAMLAKGKTRILDSGDWQTASYMSELAQLNPTDLAPQLQVWKRTGKIFALAYDGVEYFPVYGFNPTMGYDPQPGLAEIIAILSLKKDGWGMAFWLGSSNSYLGGRMPKMVFKEDLVSVLEAAKDEISTLLS